MSGQDTLSERLRATYAAWNNPPSDGLPDGAGIVLEAAAKVVSLESRLARAEADTARLNWLGSHPAAEIVRREVDGWDDDVQWEVCEIHGGRNDREWHLRGRGQTIREALDAARSLSHGEDNG